MNNALFRGSGTAMVTPFSEGAVDFPALGRLIDLQITAGTLIMDLSSYSYAVI